MEALAKEGFSAGGGPASGWDFGDLSEIFGDMFGGGGGGRQKRKHRGGDIEMDLKLNFRESVFGQETNIELYKNEICSECGGAGGEKGKKEIDCFTCGGKGQRVTQTRTMFGTFQSAIECEPCRGRGKKPEKVCASCKGIGVKKQTKVITVRIPQGVEDGEVLRVPGEGEAAGHNEPPGDLYLHLRVAADKYFNRKGLDIYSDEEINFADAVLGGTKIVNTLYGDTEIAIPAGTTSGQVFKIKNKGVERGKQKGDQYVEVSIIVPKHPSKRQKELLKEWQELG